MTAYTTYTYTLEVARNGYQRAYYQFDGTEFVPMPRGCFECDEHDERVDEDTIVSAANSELDTWEPGEITARVIDRAIFNEESESDEYGELEYEESIICILER